MDLALILQQIDAEISRLQRIREIVEGLAGPTQHLSFPKPRRVRPAAAALTVSTPTPELIILPPKQKREYSPRLKPAPTMVRALGPAPSEKPVFVPRASMVSRPEPDRGLTEVPSLEAVVRQNLLGGVA